MKVVILAGGFGTRLSEYTESIPKPMVTIGGKPIIWHIMKNYSNFGYIDFYLALGYKAELVKEYFINYRSLNSDFTVDLSTGNLVSHHVDKVDWKITLVQTGLDSMTGGRVKRLQPLIGNESFLLTYGDGISNINIELGGIVLPAPLDPYPSSDGIIKVCLESCFISITPSSQPFITLPWPTWNVNGVFLS